MFVEIKSTHTSIQWKITPGLPMAAILALQFTDPIQLKAGWPSETMLFTILISHPEPQATEELENSSLQSPYMKLNLNQYNPLKAFL